MRVRATRRSAGETRPSLALSLVVVLAFATLCSGLINGARARAATAHVVRGTPRCGFTGSPYGRIAIYVQKGKVACRTAEFVIHRAFYSSGQPTGNGDDQLFPGDWICGGQIGYYGCVRPTIQRPIEAVAGIACHEGNVTCPHIDVYPPL